MANTKRDTGVVRDGTGALAMLLSTQIAQANSLLYDGLAISDAATHMAWLARSDAWRETTMEMLACHFDRLVVEEFGVACDVHDMTLTARGAIRAERHALCTARELLEALHGTQAGVTATAAGTRHTGQELTI